MADKKEFLGIIGILAGVTALAAAAYLSKKQKSEQQKSNQQTGTQQSGQQAGQGTVNNGIEIVSVNVQ